MTAPTMQRSGNGGSSSLADVLEIVLDKGIVIDAFVRVSVIGIEILSIEARIVIASVDTYIRYVEAMSRLGQLPGNRNAGRQGLPQDPVGNAVQGATGLLPAVTGAPGYAPAPPAGAPAAAPAKGPDGQENR